jgi:hypothetical protein
MRAFFRILRILSVVTLFFFCWTFLPLWQAVAWATEKQPRMRNADFGMRNGKPEPATTGERFEKALEDIRENVGRAEKKHERGEDDKAEREHIRSKRTEIDSIDVELRKKFAATEKKLKSASLPKEILDRHYKFVKHYEDNFAELRANLDGHEKAQKAQDKVKAKEYLRKAKLHLEKTKAPSRHVPLDPNKLPFRTVKGKERAPRLKKEEFERDFPPQRHQGTKTAFATDSHGWPQINLREVISRSSLTPHTSRVLLAYNDIASDAPFQFPLPSEERAEVRGGSIPHSAFAIPNLESSSLLTTDASPTLIAQATVDLPTTDDLSETPEVQFTPEIQALAAQLNHSPVKIYEWVRNNIEFVPTYGSIQGAQMTIQTAFVFYQARSLIQTHCKKGSHEMTHYQPDYFLIIFLSIAIIIGMVELIRKPQQSFLKIKVTTAIALGLSLILISLTINSFVENRWDVDFILSFLCLKKVGKNWFTYFRSFVVIGYIFLFFSSILLLRNIFVKERKSNGHVNFNQNQLREQNWGKVYFNAATSGVFQYIILYIIPIVIFLIVPLYIIYDFINGLFSSNFKLNWLTILLLAFFFAIVALVIMIYLILRKYWVSKIIINNEGILFVGFWKKVSARWNEILAVDVSPPLFSFGRGEIGVKTKNGDFYFPFTMKEKGKEYPKLKYNLSGEAWVDANGIEKPIVAENCSLYVEMKSYLKTPKPINVP